MASRPLPASLSTALSTDSTAVPARPRRPAWLALLGLLASCGSDGGGGSLLPDASASSIQVSPDEPVVADGGTEIRITVIVRDNEGLPLSGREVEIQVSGSQNTLDQISQVTGVDGRVIASLSSTKAEEKEITAVVGTGADAVTLDASPHVHFIGDASDLSADLSSISATPESVVADGIQKSTIVVVVRDDNGNPVPGRTVEISATGTSNTIEQPPAPTGFDGTAVGTIASTRAEIKTLSAKTVQEGGAEVELEDHPPVEFLGDGDDISALLSSVTASPDEDLLADGVQTSTITVIVHDGNDNPVPGQTVEVAATGSGNTIVQPPGPTDSTGTAVATLASTVAEEKTVSVTVNPGVTEVVLVDQPQVEFVSLVSESESELTLAPDFGALADGVDTVALTVVVRNSQGNPVPGRTVVFSATGKSNTITQPSAVTDSSGVATGTLASTAAEAKTVTATVDPGVGETVLDDAPTTVLVWSSPTSRYVRTSGSDSNDGASPASAWLTIGNAAGSVTAGQTVYVGAGIYPESVTLVIDGTLGAPIAFVADSTGEWTSDAGEVVIDGQAGLVTLELDGADHVTIEGFTVIGAAAGTGVGIRVGDDPSVSVKLRANSVHTNGEGIRATGAVDLVVQENRVSRQVGSSDVGGHGIVLEGCTNASLLGNLIYVNEGNGVLVTAATIGSTIEANTFYQNIGDQIHFDALGNVVTVRNNIISEGAADGIELETGSVVFNTYNISWGHQGMDWNGLSMGTGELSADPMFVHPPGADLLLGGSGSADDRFELDLSGPSPAYDAGSANAADIAFDSGGSLADRTTRVDGVLDGTAPDGAIANMGFHYPAPLGALPVLAHGDLRLAYGVASERQPRLRTHEASQDAWSQPLLAPSTDSAPRWALHALSPLESGEELALAFREEGPSTELAALRWSGSAWYVDWSSTGFSAANATARSFDLLYLASGDALAVFSNGTANPRYRLWSGGAWSDDQPVFTVAPGLAGVLWVELATVPGAQEATLVYADADADLRAVVWDGAAWDTGNATTLESALRTVETRSFDVEYETASGDVLAVWAGDADAIGWATRAAGSVSWTVQSGIQGLGATPAIYDLAADPGSDQIALAALEDAIEGAEPKVATWTGSAWVDGTRLEIGNGSTLGAVPGDIGVAAGWVGTSGTAVIVYADEVGGAIDWGAWTSASGWVLQTDATIAGKGTTESVRLIGTPLANELLVVLSDSNGDVWSAICNGSTWTLSNGGIALETELSSIDGQPFDASLRAP